MATTSSSYGSFTQSGGRGSAQRITNGMAVERQRLSNAGPTKSLAKRTVEPPYSPLKSSARQRQLDFRAEPKVGAGQTQRLSAARVLKDSMNESMNNSMGAVNRGARKSDVSRGALLQAAQGSARGGTARDSPGGKGGRRAVANRPAEERPGTSWVASLRHGSDTQKNIGKNPDNQDSYAATGNQHTTLLAVFDGHGEHGHKASAHAKNKLVENVFNKSFKGSGNGGDLRMAMARAFADTSNSLDR